MSSNIFNSSDKSKEDFQNKVDVHSKALLSVTQRQKDLESTLDLVGEKIELLDHNSISNFKKIFSDIKSLRTEIVELRTEMDNMKDFNQKVAKQLKLMTTKDEVVKLEKYIDLWNPMEFVTREEHNKEKEEFINILKTIIEEFLTGETDQKVLKKMKQEIDEKSQELSKSN
jgi:hypothetical protein